jgi:hypothetical protein
VAKVKNILVGLPPTDEEVAAVVADPAAFAAAVDGWMASPAYAAKMQRFFALALQQTQISAADFSDLVYPKQISINGATSGLLVQNLTESFARTAVALTAAGRPLTDVLTTHQLMMTTALKEFYAFLDVWQVDNAGKVTDRFKQQFPKVSLVAEAAAGPIPITETLDPQSPNFMHWYDPDVATANATVAGCQEDPITFPPSAATLHYLVHGSLDNHKSATGVACPPANGSAATSLLTADDFADWTLVTLRPPATPDEHVTRFYDLPALRGAKEMVLSTPRVGFFTTPAFFANWQTNVSNQMRVTMNQTLIVALGAAVDGSDHTFVGSPSAPGPGVDIAHAMRPDCYACHQTLDPLRSIFSSTFSWNYHDQSDATWKAQKGLFAFQGVTQPVGSLDELGTILAQHPLFAPAWAQKLCAYVNSSPCVPDDPEFQRVVMAFKEKGFDWNTLVKALVTSPLVTGASATATYAQNDEVIAVSRRDHLCAALSARLGLTDVCALDKTTKKQGTIPQIVAGLPSDGYGRGATEPVLPNETTLFYRAGLENICEALAAQVIDVAAAKQVAGARAWKSSDPDGAIADFVAVIMALTSSDPRAGGAKTILRSHFDAARAQGASATDALRSTFTAACLAPSNAAIGF